MTHEERCLKTCEKYSLEFDRWSSIASMNLQRMELKGCVADNYGCLYAFSASLHYNKNNLIIE